jgi:hypothetical protein
MSESSKEGYGSKEGCFVSNDDFMIFYQVLELLSFIPASRPVLFIPGERNPGSYLIEGCVYPRAGLEAGKK